MDKVSEGLTHLLVHLFPAFHILTVPEACPSITSCKAATLIFLKCRTDSYILPSSPPVPCRSFLTPLPQREVHPPKSCLLRPLSPSVFPSPGSASLLWTPPPYSTVSVNSAHWVILVPLNSLHREPERWLSEWLRPRNLEPSSGLQ